MDDARSSAHELTLDEAVDIAILLQKDEQLAEARELFDEILEIAPEHARALHFAGVLAHQLKQSDDAIRLIQQSLAVVPQQADWYSNLGIVYQSTGQLERAEDAYRRAIAIDPAHANAYSNLGVVLRALGKPAEAESAYRTAIQLNPEHVDAYTNLGILLNGLNRTEEAAACYCKVITLRPRYRDARRLLALAYCTLGELDEAVRLLEQWTAEEPDDPIAIHMLAACTGRHVPGRASSEFIERTFDSFAASFESKLSRLSYRAPVLVAAMLEDSGLVAAKGLDVLDAGCGTGLCGPLLAAYARCLTGVDLSAGMLAHARDKRIYDGLIKSDLTEYLRGHTEAFDIVVSADALVYFGELTCVIDAAAGALRPGGLFVFTLEHAAGSSAGAGFRLEFHGRYTHTRAYVERLLAHAGLQATIVEAGLRTEAGAPVAGLVIRALKPGFPNS